MVLDVIGVVESTSVVEPEVPILSVSNMPAIVLDPRPARKVRGGGGTHAPARVPEVVTGEPLMLNSLGSAKPTLVSPPTPTPQAFAALTSFPPAPIWTHFPVVSSVTFKSPVSVKG